MPHLLKTADTTRRMLLGCITDDFAGATGAVAQSLAACRRVRVAGAPQIYFKVCSTFDSTAEGNIGPVMDALMEERACPAARPSSMTKLRGRSTTRPCSTARAST